MSTFLFLIGCTVAVIIGLIISKKAVNSMETEGYNSYSTSDKDKAIKLQRIVGSLSIFVIIVIWIISIIAGSLFTVTEQEQALVLTFGKYTRTVGPGLNTKIPFIQSTVNVNTMTNGRTFGYIVDENNIEQEVSSQALMITKDVNFVNAYLYVEWRIVDAYAYTYAAVDPMAILDNTLQSETKRIVSSFNVDDALTSAKTEIQALIREAVTSEIDNYKIGIAIQNIAIQDIEPPVSSVQEAFLKVENARQAMETEMNNAKAYCNEILPQAQSTADGIIKAAEAVKLSRINEANGQVARFNALYSEYSRNPEVIRTRIYFETMEYVLPRMDVYFENGDNILKTLNLDGGNKE